MLRKSWTLSILVSFLVLTLGLLSVEQTNKVETPVDPNPVAPSAAGNAAPSAITIVVGGTGGPPSTLGGFAMTPVPFFSSPPTAPACTGILPGTPIPTPAAGSNIVVSPWTYKACIGSGWATWSHGYQGDVYYTGGSRSQSIKLPAGTRAFYFYVEPNPLDDLYEFQVKADGVLSPIFEAHGSSGAKYVGVYNTAGTINSIEIACEVDFASGEYGWSGGGTCTGTIIGKVTDLKGTTPIARALVLAIKVPEKDKAGAVTADTGDYEIPDLLPGPYFVLCLKRGYSFAYAYPVEVKCDVPTKVSFKLEPVVE
jgi:hypothetical protein